MIPFETVPDDLGAHVSTAGGVQNAPARAAELGSRVLQLFTKQPSRWAEPELTPSVIDAFRAERERCGILCAAAHDAYLINLASPDPVLQARSCAAFRGELERCRRLGLEYLVSHPGSATDGDRARGLARNAEAIRRQLDEVADVTVLLETTPGSGRCLGASFAELAELIARIDGGDRVGVCVDTCHVWVAGYDLRRDYERVVRELDAAIGLHRVKLFHLNDSVGGCGSFRDRHAHIGQGTLGEEPFRALLDDARFAGVPKLLETPKDGDALAADRANLARLRGYRSRPETMGSPAGKDFPAGGRRRPRGRTGKRL
jgi:deoxyribonuclease-4